MSFAVSLKTVSRKGKGTKNMKTIFKILAITLLIIPCAVLTAACGKIQRNTNTSTDIVLDTVIIIDNENLSYSEEITFDGIDEFAELSLYELNDITIEIRLDINGQKKNITVINVVAGSGCAWWYADKIKVGDEKYNVVFMAQLGGSYHYVNEILEEHINLLYIMAFVVPQSAMLSDRWEAPEFTATIDNIVIKGIK